MNSLNRVTLIENLGKDPDYQELEGNVPVAKMDLATTESFKAKDGKKIISTDWHLLVAWRGLATFAKEYLKKGSLVYVEGKLKTRNYEDKAGQKKYVTEVIVEQILMLDKKNTANESE